MCIDSKELHFPDLNFCSECGLPKERAIKECDRLKRKIEKDLLFDYYEKNCPFSDRESWNDKYHQGRVLLTIWASIESKSIDLTSVFDVNKHKDADGEIINIHPGHPWVIGFTEEKNDSRRGYQSRVLGHISKRRYISEKLCLDISERLNKKWGNYNGRCFPVFDQERYGYYAEGPFTPIDLETGQPGYLTHCSICGDPAAVFYYPLTDTDAMKLMEEWPEKIPPGESVCSEPLCNQAAAYQSGDMNAYADYREYKVKPNRANKETLQKHPVEIQGALIAARFLDFEARYTEKKYEKTIESRRSYQEPLLDKKTLIEKTALSSKE